MSRREIMIDPVLIKRLRACRAATPVAVAADLFKFNKIASIDAEMAIVRARRALDLLLRSIATNAGIVTGTKPMDQVLAEVRRAGAIPAVIERHVRLVKEFGNIAAHGVDTDDAVDSHVVLSDAEVALCAESTTLVVNWFLGAVVPALPDSVRYVVRSGVQVTERMVDQACALDALVYRDELRGVPEVCRSWLRWNPEIYTMLIDPGVDQVVGYLNAMPLEDEAYRAIERGTGLDVAIPTEWIRKYELPDFYRLYFCSIVVHPSYQATTAFKALYDAFIDHLISLAEREIFFTEILADGVTRAGMRACEYVGMRRVRETDHDSVIFKVTLLPPALRITSTRAKSLSTYYASKYEEFRTLLP